MDRNLKRQIVGVDIGSYQVKTIIAEIDEDGVVNVIGVGKSNSIEGMSKGNIINIDKIINSIDESVSNASNMATANVKNVYITISGEHVKSSNSKAVIAVNEDEITSENINNVLKKCKDKFYSQDKEVVHLIPQNYYVDEQEGIKNPIGMNGSTLGVNTHVVSANLSNTKNLLNCVNKNNLEVKDIVFSPIASSNGILSLDEKNLGSVVIDIGYGTTTLSVYEKGYIIYSDIIPVGGFHITNDLAISLQIPIETSEKLKLKHGNALSENIPKNEKVELDDNIFDLFTVSEIIEARVSETFLLVKERIKDAKLMNKINSGVVLTGGSANLNGIQILSERIFNNKVRIGFPHKDIRGLKDLIKHPQYAASIGLIKMAQKNSDLSESSKSKITQKLKGFKKIIKQWF